MEGVFTHPSAFDMNSMRKTVPRRDKGDIKSPVILNVVKVLIISMTEILRVAQYDIYYLRNTNIATFGGGIASLKQLWTKSR